MDFDVSGQNFVKFCKNSVIKEDEDLREFTDTALKGFNSISVYFIFTCFHIISYLLCSPNFI